MGGHSISEDKWNHAVDTVRFSASTSWPQISEDNILSREAHNPSPETLADITLEQYGEQQLTDEMSKPYHQGAGNPLWAV